MKRNESGSDAGWRNVGTLALWSIPYVLGITACVWFGFAMGVREWFRSLSQEQRRAIYVGATVRPKSALKIETPNASSCVVVDRVDLDGSTAAVYFRNTCGNRVTSIKLQWQLVSPDGTLLANGMSYSMMLDGPDALGPNEKGEAVFSGWHRGIKTDPRASAVRFWVD